MESDSPVAPQTPPTPAPEPQAQPAVAPAVAAAPTPAKKSTALAITALILAITSVVIGLLWFVAAPIAIVAIILSIIALAKHHGGKGRSIAALIIGGVSLLFFVPFWAVISLVALRGIQESAEQYRVDAEYRQELESESDYQTQLFN